MSASHRRRPGFTVPEAAHELGVSYKIMRNAVQRGEVQAISFAGLKRIPAAEVERLRGLFHDIDATA